jgi:hypothetical protein
MIPLLLITGAMAVGLYAALIRPAMLDWGSTARERAAWLLGDELLPRPGT